MFKNMGSWLGALRKTNASSQVVYRRGDEAVTLSATVGKSEFDLVDGGGGVIRAEMRDYIVQASDLVLAGQMTLPQDGDQIEETIGDQTIIYDVVGPGGEPAWRFSDPWRSTLRIHTKAAATT